MIDRQGNKDIQTGKQRYTDRETKIDRQGNRDRELARETVIDRQ